MRAGDANPKRKSYLANHTLEGTIPLRIQPYGRTKQGRRLNGKDGVRALDTGGHISVIWLV